MSVQSDFAAIEIPSKYDVIPIHNSDRATFKGCRRKWDWSSPARHSLTVRADISGVYTPFMFGTGIHYGLEQFYNPGLSRDPVEAFRTWFDVVWNGGNVTHEWLERSYDLNPTPLAHVSTNRLMPVSSDEHAVLWNVRGLRDLLPDGTDQYDEIESLLPLGSAMLDNYKRYADENDGFEVVLAEHTFSVPIWDYAHDRILTAIDTREQSPNYGKELEVHARGRQDAITQKPNGKLGVMDHKTAEKMEDSAMLSLKLESDEQITTYLWAAQVEAIYYDLPHKGQPLEEAIYNVIRKAVPSPPSIVRGGFFSVDRTKECTTYEYVMDWMKDAGYSYSDLSEKHQGYVDWLREVGDEQFFVRKLVRRNQHQLQNAGVRIYQEAHDMLTVMAGDESGIYPNIRNDWSCLNCPFRAPCMAKEQGDDWQYMIDNNYAINKDR